MQVRQQKLWSGDSPHAHVCSSYRGPRWSALAPGSAVALSLAFCQLYAVDYTFKINPTQDTSTISPYIYSSNGFNDARDCNMTAMRMGGNRLTGYNWENNASNAGTDWNNSSDAYLGSSSSPGKAVTDFVDGCRAVNQKSLVTVQMAGYVAADKNGTVSAAEVAPSARWNKVVFVKGSAFTLIPDATDANVYIDELVNFLVNKYQKASLGGVYAYALDNEPALWKDTHPLIHPVAVTCAELLQKSIDCSNAIKAVDNSALVFGGVFYGYAEYENLQDASDWNSVKGSYTWFIDYYLDQMKKASTTAGQRLVDVLDLHWYPEAQGGGQRIIGSNVEVSDPLTPAAIMARMQAPRSLYDTTYKETSWISQYMTNNEPIKLLAHVKKSIDTYYPGTKVAFTEFTYGAGNHISGGIATADFLGAMGKNGVFMANKWYATEKFSAAAYRIFRNYNGSNATFGSLACQASTSNRDSTSVWASLSADKSSLHIVGINKSSSARNVSVQITAPSAYTSAEVWGFSGTDTSITKRTADAAIQSNTFFYTLPPLSVLHFVLSSGSTPLSQEVRRSSAIPSMVAAGNVITIHLAHRGTVSLTDPAGRCILSRTFEGGSRTFDVGHVGKGIYLLSTNTAGRTDVARFIVDK